MEILFHLYLLGRCGLRFLEENLFVVRPCAVDISMFSHVPRLLEEGSIFWRKLFVHVYTCALQVLSPHHDISLYCVVDQAHDDWFNPFVFSTWQFMTGNNVASQKLYAHGLIYENSNLFSDVCEFATTLNACAICLHRVAPARRSRVAAGLEVQPADYNVVFL